MQNNSWHASKEQGRTCNHRETCRLEFCQIRCSRTMSMTLLLFNNFATARFFFPKRVHRAKGLTSANSHALISSISVSVHTLERGPTCLKSIKVLFVSNHTAHTCNSNVNYSNNSKCYPFDHSKTM